MLIIIGMRLITIVMFVDVLGKNLVILLKPMFWPTSECTARFEKNTFDLVWGCESGEHMPDKKRRHHLNLTHRFWQRPAVLCRYVEEMSRVLKPKGGECRCPSVSICVHLSTLELYQTTAVSVW